MLLKVIIAFIPTVALAAAVELACATTSDSADDEVHEVSLLQQRFALDKSGPVSAPVVAAAVENATVLIQAGRTIVNSSSSSWQTPIAGINYEQYALWPNDATRRRTHAPANGRECSAPPDCKDEAICSKDGKKCKTCYGGASCYSAFETPGQTGNHDDAPIVVDDVDPVPADYNDTLFVCACNKGAFVTICTDHSQCVSEAGCIRNSGNNVKPCGDCNKGKSCGAKHGLYHGPDANPLDPPRAFCYCGGDFHGVAKCGGRWGECKNGYACDTSTGIGSKRCSDCNSGYRCKKNGNANVGKCKCKR